MEIVEQNILLWHGLLGIQHMVIILIYGILVQIMLIFLEILLYLYKIQIKIYILVQQMLIAQMVIRFGLHP